MPYHNFTNDTWLFSGGSWRNVTNFSDSPPPMSYPLMDYDPNFGGDILFGGASISGNTLNATWLYSAGRWTNETTKLGTAPPNGGFGVMTFDGNASCNCTLLFDAGYGINETWKLTRAGWSQLNIFTPPRLFDPSMAYDPLVGKIVLFGGGNLNNSYSEHGTYVFSDTGWTNVTATACATSCPGSRFASALVYLSGEKGILMFGGEQQPFNGYLSDTWLYANGSWSQLSPLEYPRGRAFAASSPIGNGSAALLYGGLTNYGGIVLGDTQVYDPPPSISIGKSASTVDRGTVVNFTSSASGGLAPLFVNWTFGDGTTSNGTNVSHSYSTTGTILATATATDQLGVEGFNHTTIEVRSLPLVNIGANAASSDVGVSIGFSATTGGGTPPLTYTWTFGDGVISNLNSTSHSFSTEGTYLVRVNVTDADGATATNFTSIRINPRPVASVPRGTNGSADVGQTVTFSSTTNGGTAPYFDYAWSGLPSGCIHLGSANVTCPVKIAGAYSITDNVTDAAGVSSGASPPLVFSVYPDPTINLSANRTAFDEGQAATFTAAGALGSGGYVFTWSGLPSGCPTSGTTLACSFSQPGKYSVSAKLTDSDGESVKSMPVSIAVNLAPSADILATPLTPVVGAVVEFEAKGTGGTGTLSFAWEFGDGSKGTGNPITHQFEFAGIYRVTLWTNDSTGASVVSARSLNVTSLPPPNTTGLSTSGLLVIGGAIVSLALVAAVIIQKTRRKRITPPRSPQDPQ